MIIKYLNLYCNARIKVISSVSLDLFRGGKCANFCPLIVVLLARLLSTLSFQKKAGYTKNSKA